MIQIDRNKRLDRTDFKRTLDFQAPKTPESGTFEIATLEILVFCVTLLPNFVMLRYLIRSVLIMGKN